MPGRQVASDQGVSVPLVASDASSAVSSVAVASSAASSTTGAFFAALAGAAAESAGPPSAAAYAHAASTAMGMVAVCWALTAVVAALDVVRRRRAVRAA